LLYLLEWLHDKLSVALQQHFSKERLYWPGKKSRSFDLENSFALFFINISISLSTNVIMSYKTSCTFFSIALKRMDAWKMKQWDAKSSTMELLEQLNRN
jgi:hypothetical protein